MTSKVLVVGDVNGRFKEVFEKISVLHSKNAFALAIISGNLFANPSTASPEDEGNINALFAGSIRVSLPTYFALGSYALPTKVIEQLEITGGEVCDQLFFLGKRTTFKTSEGIRIVALGGQFDPNPATGSSNDKYTPLYSEGDANALRGANKTDILITNEWPAGIRTGSKVPVNTPQSDPTSQTCLAGICATLKPRYHFSTSSLFFEREPFFHPPTESISVDGYNVTRFISLAPFDNTTKQKWIYAFSLDLNAANPLVIPPATTTSPFAFEGRKRAASSNGEFSRYSQNDKHHQRPNKRSRLPPPGPGECFFCLSNPNLATHLVASIGTDAYLTTAKGPLSTSSTFDSVAFPSHILIIPLAHTPTLSSISETTVRDSTIKEMQRYRTALHDMISEKSSGKMGSVTWEVSRSSGIHTHWQFLPVPVHLIRKGLVEAAFKVEAENEQYPRFEVSPDAGFTGDRGDFFRAWIWQPKRTDGIDKDESDTGNQPTGTDESIETSLTLRLDDSFRFDLQFGRRVLAKLLEVPNRSNWRDCGQSEADETTDAEIFKEAFKKFDFTLED